MADSQSADDNARNETQLERLDRKGLLSGQMRTIAAEQYTVSLVTER